MEAEKSTARSEDYHIIAEKVQKSLNDSIPEKFRLSTESKKKLSEDPPQAVEASGLLSSSQLRITALTATELLQKIATGELKAVDVVEAFIARAAVAHQLTNCLVEFMPDEAATQAKALDDILIKTGKPVGPLHGLPLPVKDILQIRDHITTMGFVAWNSFPPATDDASVVKVMRDAGAIIFCRTTCPQAGMALETVSNLWGRTLNSINPNFGAGGSSGGDGALVGLRGAPASSLSTDVGGSVRAPAAFNGLFGMRPTHDRVPRTGFCHPALGNTAIKSAAGPITHSVEDLKLFTRLIVTHPTLPYESTCILPFWDEGATAPSKLKVGLMLTDGVVEPHPPIARALRETANKLKAAGHEVVNFQAPFDCWQAMLTTFKLYFQTGAKEARNLMATAKEPAIAALEYNLRVFECDRELNATEIFHHSREQARYKALFQQAWDAAGIDVLLCPVSPMAAVPHDFCVWWGYTSLFNLLDYPSTNIPVKGVKVDEQKDVKGDYQPKKDNPFDKPNWDIYDPSRWKNHPSAIQIVGRPFRDEALIAITEVIDRVVN
ncbi:putative amidase [Piedraia hortae CBS 480.64]|uniref:Putative amidase n=1 Tax=Piedraia hortae CBS 480.64 TaxID=1314780 RepID=A0A6A7BTK8_9PEZI|nr:putative amidase [Piedraia hortae CBS 480.64]